MDAQSLREAGRIDGAQHIPLDELSRRVGEVDRDRPIVTVCRSGRRSAAAADLLAAQGLNADNLDGGLEDWTSAGLRLTRTNQQPGQLA